MISILLIASRHLKKHSNKNLLLNGIMAFHFIHMLPIYTIAVVSDILAYSAVSPNENLSQVTSKLYENKLYSVECGLYLCRL